MFNRIAPTLLAATATMAIATSAQAQTSSEDQASGLDAGNAPIIVTARRQNETLADVPASITVFTEELLQTNNIRRAEDFIGLTPGVTIVTNTAEAGDSQINIRGINGTRDAESSVALVVDGILRTNTAALNQDQGTLRQVEILKGPQGALYGRNAAAGAIVITTVEPSDVLEGSVRGSYGSENTWELNGYIAGPLTDNIGFVLSGDYRSTDGFYENLFLNNSNVVDDQEVWNVNARLMADLGPDTELDFKVRYGELRGASINFNAAFHLPNFAGANPAFFEDVDDHEFRYYSNIRPTNSQDTLEASIKLEHDFGNVQLTAWALYSNIENALTADGTSADFARYISAAFALPNIISQTSTDASNACFASTAALTGFPVNQPGFIGATPVPFIFAPATGSTFGPYSPTTCDGTQYQIRDQEDISVEIRLSSTDGPIDWQLGAYYLHIDRQVGVSLGADLGQGIIRELYNAPGTANPTSQLFHDDFSTDVFAAFGSVEAEVTSRLTLGAAVRYDVEERSVNNLVPNVLDPITGGPINPGQAFGPIQPQDASFDQIQPRLSLNYGLTDDINVYATWGIGFKSGGFNNQGSAAIVDQNFNQFLGTNILIQDQFNRERSSAFELGIRGSSGPWTFDLAGYYTEIDDMQFFEFFVGPFGLLRVVSNIDEVEVMGLEFNTNVEIVPGWDVFGSFNWTDSEIQANSSRPNTIGNESPYTPDYTINVGSQIIAPITRDFDILVRGDYRIVGPTWFHTVQDQITPTLFSGLLPGSALALPAFVGDADNSATLRNSYSVFNFRAGFQNDRWRLMFFAENLFDERYPAEVIPAIEFGGSFISPGPRRVIGVEAGITF
ncbi:TonB-dependent receptor [Parasphingopyxis sp. CP4]|uniref:TonB-dependent receptor n=1 Tax=Parasphingopyxis sp. CP4 TaxID=2724527 RepID=UPI0015A2FD66|nr:TonB-dependent receptor [Parasphingopyxis sp. CP4]QLC22465.1 TonB-dependent receptor [Parasphingopyxis sp. CP4]